ncbi:FtsX-like permease family protein [Salinigranum sp.]|uniref:FtsX-like permease family protein n=1 Tax=Salinigranum sp. TaxID=1966351 RepID=UPI003564DD90
MGYRQALALRWSRRDRLAVLVIAVTIAFLTGVTLLGLAMAGQTTAIAADFDSPGTVESFDSVAEAEAAAGSGEYVLPVTTVSLDGERRTVVGIPTPPPEVSARGQTVTFPAGRDGVLAATTQQQTVRASVETAAGTREVTFAPRPPGALVPDGWYVTTATTVETLGPTSAFVLAPDSPGFVPSGEAVPLLSVLAFFVLGTRQLVDLLLLTSLAGGVLVAVTTFSVTRVVVEDRRETISVVRSTGASPLSVYAIFGVRALLLTGIGVAFGYALGLVLVRSVVNAAVFAGAPTSLSISVTTEAVRLLAPTSAFVALLGGAAGVVAARPAVRPPPAAVTRPSAAVPTRGGSLDAVRRRLRPTLLDWDALVPSTATLSVFVLFVLLIAASGGALASLTPDDQQTITEADAAHPIESKVPVSYAETLQQQGVAASPEILLFEVSRGEPFLVRGVDYQSYAAVSDSRIVRGRPPQAADEAVVGADLARTLNVDVGDTLTLGGSTRPAFTRVEIVGVFAATGVEDDQLLVSLETGERLSANREGEVNFIRTEPIDPGADAGPTLSVLGAAADPTDRGTELRLVVQNYGLAPLDETVSVRFGDDTRPLELDLRPGQTRGVTLTFPQREPGEYELRVAGYTQSVAVGAGSGENALSVDLPTSIPPGSQPQVTVTRDGRPVADATVSLDGREGTWTTNGDGVVRVPFPEAGSYTVVAMQGDATARTDVRAVDGAERRLTASVAVRPQAPSIATRPTAVATLKNPWEQPVTQTVTLVQGPNAAERELTLQPGATTEHTLRLPPRAAGSYTVTLLQNGRNTSAAQFAVQGDERLAAALASSGRRSSGGGIAQAITVVFGNIRVLVAAMVALVGLMTVGATTASFARSIHAARDEVGVRRAVGASPGGIYRLVLGDVLRVGGVSAVLAVSVASALVWLLLSLGELRLFGVVLRPTFSPTLLLAAGGCALGLALLSAVVAAFSLVSASPATLLAPVSRDAPTRPERPRSGLGGSEVRSDD